MTEEGKGWQPGDQGGGAGEEGPEKGGWGRGGAITGKRMLKAEVCNGKNVNKAITVLKQWMCKQEHAHPQEEPFG